MGIKYALASSTEDMPTMVEGLKCWSETKDSDPGGPVVEVCIAVLYWDGATALFAHLVRIYCGKVTGNGGTVADWDTLVTKAVSASDFDDVAEEMTLKAWGNKLLWGNWYGIIGQ